MSSFWAEVSAEAPSSDSGIPRLSTSFAFLRGASLTGGGRMCRCPQKQTLPVQMPLCPEWLWQESTLEHLLSGGSLLPPSLDLFLRLDFPPVKKHLETILKQGCAIPVLTKLRLWGARSGVKPWSLGSPVRTMPLWPPKHTAVLMLWQIWPLERCGGAWWSVGAAPPILCWGTYRLSSQPGDGGLKIHPLKKKKKKKFTL